MLFMQLTVRLGRGHGPGACQMSNVKFDSCVAHPQMRFEFRKLARESEMERARERVEDGVVA